MHLNCSVICWFVYFLCLFVSLFRFELVPRSPVCHWLIYFWAREILSQTISLCDGALSCFFAFEWHCSLWIKWAKTRALRIVNICVGTTISRFFMWIINYCIAVKIQLINWLNSKQNVEYLFTETSNPRSLFPVFRTDSASFLRWGALLIYSLYLSPLNTFLALNAC